MTKPKVFISHSTKNDPKGASILRGLMDFLRNDYDVLVDQDLDPGGPWRNTINFWTGHCDAAVMLVTSDSMASEFCKYEWSVLSFRHNLTVDGARFPLVPIFVGVEPNAFQSTPQRISDPGAIIYQDAESTHKKVAEFLGNVPRMDSPAQQHAAKLAKLLKEKVGRDDLLPGIARKMKVDLRGWGQIEDPWLNFALNLMAVGLQGALPGLSELTEHFNDWETMLVAIQLIASSWVDLACAEMLRLRAEDEDSENRLVGLNARRPETARIYVVRASGKLPRSEWQIPTWTIACVPAQFNGYNDDEFINEVQQELLEQLDPANRDVAKLAENLRYTTVDCNEQVILVLFSEGLTQKRLSQLRRRFPTVTYFLLSTNGDATLLRQQLSDDAVLRPELEHEHEENFWTSYYKATNHFRTKY